MFKTRIRKFVKEDIGHLFELLSDPAVMQYLEDPFDQNRTATFLHEYGLCENPGIFACEDERGQFIGYIIFHPYDESSYELGWVLKKEIWGRGYGQDLLKQMILKAEAKEKDCVMECVRQQNATKHIAMKYGFIKEEDRDGLQVFRRKHRLSLHIPDIDELWFKEKMMNDPETMSYNNAWGGTIPFDKDQWNSWYERWIAHHENRRFYRYLKEESGSFAGEIAYHFDESTQMFLADVIIYAPFRNRGYGSLGLAMLCEQAVKNGIDVIYDDLAADNPALTMFLNQGFEIEETNETVILLKKDLFKGEWYGQRSR